MRAQTWTVFQERVSASVPGGKQSRRRVEVRTGAMRLATGTGSGSRDEQSIWRRSGRPRVAPQRAEHGGGEEKVVGVQTRPRRQPDGLGIEALSFVDVSLCFSLGLARRIIYRAGRGGSLTPAHQPFVRLPTSARDHVPHICLVATRISAPELFYLYVPTIAPRTASQHPPLPVHNIHVSSHQLPDRIHTHHG